MPNLSLADNQNVVIAPVKEEKRENSTYLIMKRTFDLLSSLIAMLVLVPVFLIIVLFIKFDSEGPAIYSQQRVGKDGKVFTMYKFRSMCSNADQLLEDLQNLNEKDGPVFKISQDPRVTRVGRIIRKTSLDELPQLLNVLKGEMSIVGPRPALIREVRKYSEYEKQRLSVTPGLTCYWQIKGRSNLTFKEWVSLDLKYIQERNFKTDLVIILKTIPVVLFGIGAC